MATVSYYLKDPQKKIKQSEQVETVIFLAFSYGYKIFDANGKEKYKRLKYSTGISVLPNQWNPIKQRVKKSSFIDFQSINTKLDNLEALLKKIELSNRKAPPDKLRELMNIELKNDKKIIVTLNSFIDSYINEAIAGTRLTVKGTKYKKGTIKAVKGFKSIFGKYQEDRNISLSFDDINLDFYNDFLLYLTTKNYSPNTIGRHIKHLKVIMHEARDLGYHSNYEVDNKAFKIITIEVQDIYLTSDELERLEALDLSNNKTYDKIRDVFLVGCYTAQRYSDYSRINENNIKGRVLHLIQKKTGETVIIPIKPQLKAILKKYDNNLPITSEQVLNRYIKKIGALAEINDIIETENTKGGAIIRESVFKHELIKSHTARRTGATLMYLAGIPSIDIMKITGHRSEREFLKYIKTTKEETAEKLLDNPYFN